MTISGSSTVLVVQRPLLVCLLISSLTSHTIIHQGSVLLDTHLLVKLSLLPQQGQYRQQRLHVVQLNIHAAIIGVTIPLDVGHRFLAPKLSQLARFFLRPTREG